MILSGHQPGFWHAGIAAKWMASEAAARALGGACAWLVVDQDSEDFTTIRYPVIEGGHVQARRWAMAPASVGERLRADEPAGLIEAFEPGDVPRDAEGPARMGLEAMRGALVRHRGAASAAEQVARGAAELLGARDRAMVFASGLWRAPVFERVLAKMGADPRGCVESYNAAVAAHAGAGMRPLAVDAVRGRVELPLWRLERGVPRRRVYSDELASIPRERLAPRALLMTAVLRLGVCDLFIHGTGGAGTDGASGYEAVTDGWVRDWLGEVLAPAVLVTATATLDLGRPARVREEEVRRAVWLHHHARHDPASLGDAAGAAAKRAMVERIDGAGAGQKRALFGEMHGALERVRQSRSGVLEALGRGAAEAARAFEDEALLRDRTWAFPLHTAERLGGLKAEVEARFG